MAGKRIKVFDKVVQVIDLLASSTKGVKLTEAAQSLGLNKTTASRILHSLESHSLAVRDGDSTFMLGHRVLWWETSYRRNFEFLTFVRPILKKIRNLTAETAAFNIVVGERSVLLDQAISPHVTSARFDLGISGPLHAGASGKAALAHFDPERRKMYLCRSHLERFTSRTITNRRRLEKELDVCRAEGFAISIGEKFASTTSVATPLLGNHGEVLGVLSVVGPSDRLTRDRCRSIASILLREVRLLTKQLWRANAGAEKSTGSKFQSL